ncbi:MAG: hypothetical protein ABR603_13900 [Pyrinomonadaceae bacterium]
MKLKSLLAAPLLLASLALTAAAQTKPVTLREGDIMRGPVKGVRVERVKYDRVGGEPVEGPRLLVATSAYTPDGKRQEQESYAPDGAVTFKRVFVYDDAGKEIEHSLYDARGELQMRLVRRPAEGEVLTYNGDGTLRERRVARRSPDGTVVELRIYDGGGALRERSETKKEGGVSVTRTYAPDGTLKKSAERGPGAGPRQSRLVNQTYDADGTVYGRRVTEFASGNGALHISADNDGYNPGPKKTRETREFDSRKNLSKVTSYVWNEAAGAFEPEYVTYYTLTYYR